MKYEILFTTIGSGVWTRHDTLESAEKHIKMLTNDSRGSHLWSIFCSGQLVKTNKKDPIRNPK